MGDEETKFYLLDPVAGWRDALMDNILDSREKGGICLKKVQKKIKNGIGAFGGLDIPTGVALDKYGNIYIVDTDRNQILKYDSCQESPVALPCLGGNGKEPREFNNPKGIAVSPSGNLYIADTNNHRIQIFSLKGLVLRAIMGAVDEHGQPETGTGDGEFNSPWDLAIDSQENVYVVDKGNNRIQKFSRFGNFLLEFGKNELSSPEHIAIDKHDQIYVMGNINGVLKFTSGGKFLGTAAYTEEVSNDFIPPAITVDSAGRIHYKIEYPKFLPFSPDVSKREQSKHKEDCYILLEGIIPEIFFENSKLVINGKNIPEPVDDEIQYVTEGTFYSQALDSKVYKCQWHRILLEADIPAGTSIKVDTYSLETHFLKIKDPSTIWQTNQANAKDFLIQSQPGRYLWMKITFKGNVRETPVIKRIQIFYPRVSYLQYLPRIYQEDPTSKWFLGRFLSIFEHFLSRYEDEITDISRYFNPNSTRREFLPWLASWLALTLDAKWPEEKNRELIKRAHQLFKMRGTLQGLQDVLEIYTGVKFPILEHFKIMRWLVLGTQSILGCSSLLWGKEVSLGETTELGSFALGNIEDPPADPFESRAHKFSLMIPLSYCNTEEKEIKVRRIVELWKPAHTQYFLAKVEPKFRVGLQSRIGVDTLIARYPIAILGYTSRLGKDSVLGEALEERGSPTFVLNKNVRLSTETVIN